jgi:regulatory protein
VTPAGERVDDGRRVSDNDEPAGERVTARPRRAAGRPRANAPGQQVGRPEAQGVARQSGRPEAKGVARQPGRPGANGVAPQVGYAAAVEQDDPEAVARLICLRLLTAAPRTKAQLATALRRRGVPDEAVEAVLARFAEVKLIDDAMFARAWVESRHYGRGLAGRALGAELRRRGVTQQDIRTALDELGPEQELATARQLVARRLAATSGMPVQARMRRLTGVLARKGYPAALAYRVAREALEQEPQADTGVASELAELPEPDYDDEAAES